MSYSLQSVVSVKFAVYPPYIADLAIMFSSPPNVIRKYRDCGLHQTVRVENMAEDVTEFFGKCLQLHFEALRDVVNFELYSVHADLSYNDKKV